MNHYAAEQLARQRHDHFALEVRGDHLMHAASNADSLSEPTGVRSPTRGAGGMIKTIRDRALAVAPRLLSGIRVKTIG
jgi:hypothetical protein